MEFLEIPQKFLNNLGVMWTFFLLVTRFTGFFFLIPGIGGGATGVTVRIPAILVLAYASMSSSPAAVLPDDVTLMVAQTFSEFLFGLLLGMIPMLVVNGVQTGAQIASGTMGLGASQLMDPTTGGQIADLARLLGDLTVITFLLLGGHHVAIQAVAGMGSSMAPGSFVASDITLALIIDRCGDMFRVGVMISAPVVVALLLTQFVMGLVTKAVPTVNIFIVSFPLTIAIGLILSIMALPDMFRLVAKEVTGIENSLAVLVTPPPPK